MGEREKRAKQILRLWCSATGWMLVYLTERVKTTDRAGLRVGETLFFTLTLLDALIFLQIHLKPS